MLIWSNENLDFLVPGILDCDVFLLLGEGENKEICGYEEDD